MLRSRMFTTAFRFFAGLAIASLVAAFVVGVTSETQTPMDRILGPLTMGW
jgi:ABC-type nitrate/sulfonate/bicarbonate transport system permease component